MSTPKKKTSWGKRLVEFRRENGFTQEEAARRIGVTRRAWIYWEMGVKEPSLPIIKLLEAFLRHPDEFLAE